MLEGICIKQIKSQLFHKEYCKQMECWTWCKSYPLIHPLQVYWIKDICRIGIHYSNESNLNTEALFIFKIFYF